MWALFRQRKRHKHAVDPRQETSNPFSKCTTLLGYFQQMLCELFSSCAINGTNALPSNMHDMSLKGSVSPWFCLSGRNVWQQATMGKKTQIVEDQSEVCVSVSWLFLVEESWLAWPIQSTGYWLTGAADMVHNVLKHWSMQGTWIKPASCDTYITFGDLTHSRRIVCKNYIIHKTAGITMQQHAKLDQGWKSQWPSWHLMEHHIFSILLQRKGVYYRFVQTFH